MTPEASRRAERRGVRFAALTTAAVRRLPGNLPDIVPPSLLGFAIINTFTFGVDLASLTVLHSMLNLRLALAVTAAYCIALSLNFSLNRGLNFRSRTPVGPQITRYVVVAAVNYLLWILGVGAGLAALGVEYHVARVAAGVCEGIYMYCCLRWLVFREP